MSLLLVALHGFTLAGAMFAELAKALDVPVAAPDLPGHGTAAALPANLGSALDAVHAAVAAGPVTLLGYSMGGRIALHYALHRPAEVAALVLVSASAGIADPGERARRRAADDDLAADIARIGVEAFVDNWMDQPMFAGLSRRGRAWLLADRRKRLGNDPAGLAAALRGLGPGSLPPVWDRLGELALPVLVVAGAEDPAYVERGERMAAAIPGAEVVTLPGVGHAVVGEAPDDLAGVVRSFLVRRGFLDTEHTFG